MITAAGAVPSRSSSSMIALEELDPTAPGIASTIPAIFVP
ncbi:uncharacterized protein METZ01_LOCUS80457 [marine metagenome]|uniref:Uncharacterized protein n=1 Tax=marine metagenome TaxID=408172 RepID=A0A381ULE3_9ZZZZ